MTSDTEAAIAYAALKYHDRASTDTLVTDLSDAFFAGTLHERAKAEKLREALEYIRDAHSDDAEFLKSIAECALAAYKEPGT